VADKKSDIIAERRIRRNKMSKNIAISLFGSAVHPELWMRMYNSLSSNAIPFEIIFVGNNRPKFKLPDNCHFIYSEVKPPQCFEIGIRYATNDLIMPFVDDLVFSEHALDNLYKEFKKLNDDKVILSCRYVLEGKDIAEEVGHYWADDFNSPTMPLAGLMKREMWKQIGGVDRRFTAMFWDLDLAMRVYEIGGRVVLSKNVFAEEMHPQKGFSKFSKKIPRVLKNILRLFPKFRRKLITLFLTSEIKKKNSRLFIGFGLITDRSILEKFWVIKNGSQNNIPPDSIHCISTREDRGILSKIRLLPVMPFEDKHILTVSQGPKGRWR
jgi:hypothetical protein